MATGSFVSISFKFISGMKEGGGGGGGALLLREGERHRSYYCTHDFSLSPSPNHSQISLEKQESLIPKSLPLQV